MPKPLAPVDGRPFLSHLVEQLRDQGIERVTLLTGYRGEMIQDYFGDGDAFGVRIDYSHGPAEWETARRVYEAAPLLDERFMLLYSDNFVPMRVEPAWKAHVSSNAVITLLLQRKAKGNIRLRDDGTIDVYDPTRSASGLDYVEIGYMIVEREMALAQIEDPDVSFSRVLQRLTAQGCVLGLISGDPYQSISDEKRWHRADEYFRIKRILLIDRDGTINARPPRGEYVTTWDRFHWIPETTAAMRLLAQRGFRFIVISNQAGIARGMLDASVVDDINGRMTKELAAAGVEVLDTYVCPHHWDDTCDCRKPRPGLFFRASREHLLRLDRTIYVGDDPRDALAAWNAGCLSVLVGPERDNPPGPGVSATFTAATMLDAVPWIVAQFEKWETAAPERRNLAQPA